MTKKLKRLITGTNILKTDMTQLILVVTGFFYCRILKIELKFTLKSYRISVEKAVHKPECYRIDGMVFKQII